MKMQCIFLWMTNLFLSEIRYDFLSPFGLIVLCFVCFCHRWAGFAVKWLLVTKRVEYLLKDWTQTQEDKKTGLKYELNRRGNEVQVEKRAGLTRLMKDRCPHPHKLRDGRVQWPMSFLCDVVLSWYMIYFENFERILYAVPVSKILSGSFRWAKLLKTCHLNETNKTHQNCLGLSFHCHFLFGWNKSPEFPE